MKNRPTVDISLSQRTSTVNALVKGLSLPTVSSGGKKKSVFPWKPLLSLAGCAFVGHAPLNYVFHCLHPPMIAGWHSAQREAEGKKADSRQQPAANLPVCPGHLHVCGMLS